MYQFSNSAKNAVIFIAFFCTNEIPAYKIGKISQN